MGSVADATAAVSSPWTSGNDTGRWKYSAEACNRFRWRSRRTYPSSRRPEQRLEKLELWWTCPEHAGLQKALRVFPFGARIPDDAAADAECQRLAPRSMTAVRIATLNRASPSGGMWPTAPV